MIMRAAALLEKNPAASEQELRTHMNANLCRCGTHMRILAAIRRAASEMQAAVLPSPERGGAMTIGAANELSRRNFCPAPARSC